MGKLTKAQRQLLYVLSKASRLVPYDNATAVSLIRMGLAERTTAFERLRITEAGRLALSHQEPTCGEGFIEPGLGDSSPLSSQPSVCGPTAGAESPDA